MTEEIKDVAKVRRSEYGFYCADCGHWTHHGYDSRDKWNLPKGNAVCVSCGDRYENK